MTAHGNTVQARNMSDGMELSHRITQWAQNNDWYHTDIQSNQLRLEQAFGQAIETITKDLDYQNQPKLRRQVFDCYDMLMAKSRQIDMVYRTGCRSEEELLELEFLRSKAVGAATELAEVLGLLRRKSVPLIPMENRVAATDHREVDGGHTVSPIDLGIASVAATQCGNDTLTYPGQASEDWITFAQAAEILAVSKSTLTRWADDGKIQSNGQKGRLRKLNKVSVLLQKQAIEDQAVQKDIRELREDAKAIANQGNRIKIV